MAYGVVMFVQGRPVTAPVITSVVLKQNQNHETRSVPVQRAQEISLDISKKYFPPRFDPQIVLFFLLMHGELVFLLHFAST